MAKKSFTTEERKQLEQLAHRRGFKSLRRYLDTLIQQAVKERSKRVEIAADDNALDDPAESFLIGWAQAMRGEGLTEEEFWKAVREDE